ncbi:MAG TPA: YggS family pyridoxal phosphate-dependent enzyme [Thermoanaerobaculia bacterium]|nr:YggS family pyridoxal phosphate-dependent enzyme [Thermoanaerobaculia bacterium]
MPAIPARRGPRLSPRATSGTALEDAAAVGERVSEIRSRIAAAARRAGRDPASVTLIGASKGQPAERVRAAWEAGVEVFGESRVQEALAKMPLLPPAIEWHFIGPLQTNKARAAAAALAAFHSVDRPRLAEVLHREAVRLGRVLPCFLEVNLAGEPTKHGFTADDLLTELPSLIELQGLEWVGLMSIPPAGRDATAARPWFRALAELRDRVRATLRRASFSGWLSMGMSDDFEVAVEEGATHVRIGTALFGPRPASGDG